MTKRTSTALICILVLGMIGASTCVGNYGVEAHNQGTFGVLILKLGDRLPRKPHNYYKNAGVGFPIIAGLHPGISGDTAVWMQKFQGHEWTLPLSVEVVWQLADLSECRIFERNESYPGGIRKRGCKWTPLPNRIYRKRLDLVPLRKTTAFWKAGWPNPRVPLSRYSLGLNLIFNDDQLYLESYTWTSNPWS